MANDKDFILKNDIEVGGSTKVTIGDAPASGSVTVGYDLSVAAYDDVRFDIQSQDTSAQAVRFGDIGTKMYIMGYTNKRVYQYTLTTAYDISTASYASKNLSVNGENTSPLGVDFKTDGTKMYMAGGGQIYQYTLSTAWDVSTGSFDSVSFSTTSQDTNPRSVLFKSDGLSMFITGASNDAVYQYTLSTAWDLSTASYASKSYSIPFTNAVPEALAFNGDGTQMFITNSTEDKVHRFNLSTAYDVSTASDPSINFSYASEISTATGLVFNSDGTKIILLSSSSVSGNDAVFQYTTGSTVATATFDTSTGNYFTHTPSADAEYGFSNAGDVQTFQLEVTGNQSVVGYELSEAAYDSVSFNIGTLLSPVGPYSFYMKPDGTKMYITNSDASYGLEEFELSTAFDLSTTTHSGSFSVSGQDTNLRGITFKPDGTKMYLTGRTNDRVYEYALSTAWDVTSASYTDFLSISSKHTNPTALTFNNNGTKLYTVGSSSLYINEWALSTAYDVSSATYSQQFQIQGSSPTGIYFTPDGTTIFIVTSGNDIVYEYSLSTAYDVSTMVHQSTQDFHVAVQATFPSGMAFNTDGTKMYICDASTTTVYQYSTSISTPITITWDADIEWGGGTAPSSPAANQKDLYTITTDDGGTTYFGVPSGVAFS